MLDSKQRIRNLIEQLKEYDIAYNEGHPIISDIEYDKLYFELVRLEREADCYFQDSPTQCINYTVVNELKKKTHNHPMLSLDKTKDWNTFLQYFGNHDVIGMVKLDGLTCSLRYNNGVLVEAETRGNGIEGEDILHSALVVANIPNKISYKGELVIDGEIISTYSNFENFKNEYANPRNFAAGSIRLLDSAEVQKRGLRFIAWNLITEKEENSHLANLHFLESLGFTIVPWTSSFDWDAKEFLIEEAERYGYPIDGLVGRFDDIKYGESLGSTSHHSKAAFAFKFADETATARLTGIEWTMGRTGTLTPVATFTPIELEGTIVERSNLHNISVMHELLHGDGFEGQEVQVFKANMIIPQIQSAESDYPAGARWFEIPHICPICGGLTAQVTEIDSTVLICTNEQCEGKLINRLDHALGKKGLDIKGISKATLEKLIEWKWVGELTDIFELYHFRDNWIQKPGFGEKSVIKILDAIDLGCHCELYQFISALGIPLIGTTAAKDLANYFKTWEAFIEAVENDFKFYDIPGFGIEMHNSIKHFNFTEAKYIYYNYMKINKVEEKEIKNTLLENKVFCVTGTVKNWKNRDELKAFIEENGGKVTTSVSKNTNYLINNAISSTSSKNMTAKRLGIPIITEEELLALIEN